MFIEVVSGTLGAFGVLAPSVQEASNADPEDVGKRRNLRVGEVMAGIWSFVIAAYFAAKNNSPKPYLYWALAASSLLVTYEVMVRMKSTDSDDG